MLHATLMEAKEEVGICVNKIEILGRLGPPTRSLSGLRARPCVASSKCCIRAFPPNNLDEGISGRKTVRVIPKRRRCITTTFASLVVPDITSCRGLRRLASPSQSFQTLVISESTSSGNPPRIWYATLQTSWGVGSNGLVRVLTPRTRRVEDSVDG